MDFEIEYKLGLFREEQPSLFDENGERYTATPIGKETAEMMLQLINEMEKALAEKPNASEDTLPIDSVRGCSSKPTPEQYGFAHKEGFDGCEGGWMYEEGEDRYYEALEKWEKDNNSQ